MVRTQYMAHISDAYLSLHVAAASTLKKGALVVVAVVAFHTSTIQNENMLQGRIHHWVSYLHTHTEMHVDRPTTFFRATMRKRGGIEDGSEP